MGLWHETSRTEHGREIPGKSLSAFIHNHDAYFVTTVNVYQDGMIGCQGLVPFERFQRDIAAGRVVTTLPEHANVRVGFLGTFTATHVRSWVKEEEFVKEIADILHELNGEPTSLQICQEAFAAYLKHPSKEHQEHLRQAYEQTPKHTRKYLLGDMDRKDTPIRKILSGGEVSQHTLASWQHYLKGHTNRS